MTGMNINQRNLMEEKPSFWDRGGRFLIPLVVPILMVVASYGALDNRVTRIERDIAPTIAKDALRDEQFRELKEAIDKMDGKIDRLSSKADMGRTKDTLDKMDDKLDTLSFQVGRIKHK